MCRAQLAALPESVQRVASFLQSSGHPHRPVMLADAARTAQQAADALGVELGQIAKSMVFTRKSDHAAVLVVTSGDRRVNEKKVEALVCHDGQRLVRADAEFVKIRTGYSIGGVCPLQHPTNVLVLIDRSLLRFKEVWAAAGHPHAVFMAMPQELEVLTGAPVVDVAVDVDEEATKRRYATNIIAAHARMISAGNENIPSPCISVCRMNADNALCEGCFRTLSEISGWSGSGPQAQRALWQTIVQRAATATA